ncbi:hypothetical protein LSCM1_01967 [Leishmania martiniquensis]|uniref:Uncharacterized protein n=1 Tax=Leishmania martiniquensis TaxID=1580590 RepID=A0A836KEA7_9TRYP|nr:hypothetical protein LSCM1_01967 [Leishmania martiniquensis]
MRQRTVSRSRARSQVSISAAEEEDLRLGLQRFLDKLRHYQPLFTEDDVTAIPFPPEGSSSCVSGGSPYSSAPTSLRHSPSRFDNEEATLHDTIKSGGSSQSTTKGKKGSIASHTPTGSPTFHSASVIDLDVPLSASLFLTAVNIFEAKLLSKSKRVSTDALKLVRQAYALVWRDPDYLATRTNGDASLAGSSSAGSSTPTAGGSRKASAPLASPHKKPHLTSEALFSASAPAPTQRPERQLVLQLDECIRTLLVYANASVNLCQSVSTDSRMLLLIAFVACSARRLEEEDDVPCAGGLGSAAEIAVGNRNLHAEVVQLESLWRRCGIEGRVADYLRECYLIEFLLDAALPPAVCSARYDGLQMALYEKKQRIISDVVTSRAGFAHMMQVAPLRGLCGLASMSAFGNSKLRARLLDRMASEGIVERLAAEMAGAIEVILAPNTTTATPARSPTKRPRQSAARGESPPHQRLRAGASTSASSQGSPGSVPFGGKARRASPMARASTALERLLESDPTPVERIGMCVDILMLLTCPDLRPRDSGEESPSRLSASSASAAVRSTTWASRDAALHEISLYLLSICFLSKNHARYAELSSLQLYAADCMLQWAAYSGAFYAIVVHAMDVLVDTMEAAAASPPTTRRKSPHSRSSSPQNGGRKATTQGDQRGGERGRRVLQQLMPGDEAGLLPLLINLLQYTIHAQANAKSIRRWFSFLANRLLPEAFEAPQLTNGRPSSAAWGQQQQREQQRCSQVASRASWLPGGLGSSSLAALDDALDAPVLARDLTRSEVAVAAPYFCFARRTVEETSWRDGTQALFAKVVLLAFHVIVTQGHRCNLLFGQACACYDVVAPVLLLRSSQSGGSATPGSRSSRSSWRSSPSSTGTTYRRSLLLMHQLEEERASMQAQVHSNEGASEDSSLAGSEARGAKGEDDENEVFIGSTGRRRSPSTRRPQRGSPMKANAISAERHAQAIRAGEDEGLSPFISSPSRSLVFYEVCSPSGTEVNGGSPLDGGGTRRRRSPSGGRRCVADDRRSLRAALDEAASAAPAASATVAEPLRAVSHSWRGRLSLRSLLSSIGGHSEVPLLEIQKHTG